jgi:hypothetical protein
MESGVSRWLEDWVFSGDIHDCFFKDMESADSLLRRIAWGGSLADVVKANISHDFFNLARSLVRDRIMSTTNVDEIRAEIGPVAHAYFDIYSLLGSGETSGDEWLDDAITFLARSSEPLHRERYVGELVVLVKPVAAVTPEFVVNVSAGISALAGSHETFKAFVALEYFGRLPADAMNGLGSAGNMLELQVKHELCPNLSRVAEFLKEFGLDHPFHTMLKHVSLLKLIRYCRDFRGSPTVSASLILGEFFQTTVRTEAKLPETPQEEETFFTSLTPQRWPLDLWEATEARRELQRLIQSYFETENLFRELEDGDFMFRTHFELRDRFEPLMRGVGRALALAIRLKLNIGEIELAPLAIDLLQRLDEHDTQDYDYGSEADLYEILEEPMFFIQLGAMEVLGPASFSAFPRSALGTRFR